MSWLQIVVWVARNIPEMVNILVEIVHLVETLGHPQSEGLRVNVSDLIKSNDHAGVKAALVGAIPSPSEPVL